LDARVLELYGQARYDEAIPLAQQALAIRKKVLGSEHPDTAISVTNVAAMYQAMGAYVEAEPLYQQALAIQEKVLGSEHRDTANSLTILPCSTRLAAGMPRRSRSSSEHWRSERKHSVPSMLYPLHSDDLTAPSRKPLLQIRYSSGLLNLPSDIHKLIGRNGDGLMSSAEDEQNAWPDRPKPFARDVTKEVL
jgi:tetratricopeptide (TPR) repeat protein